MIATFDMTFEQKRRSSGFYDGLVNNHHRRFRVSDHFLGYATGDHAKHNGYRRVIKQNIKFKTDNVEYWLERYCSPSLKKTYEAKLPESLPNLSLVAN